MEKELLLREDEKTQKVKEIAIVSDPRKLKLILNNVSWRILVMLSEKEMYPLEMAKVLKIHEQKVYYHIRKLENEEAREPLA
jgi:DNA-binding MarR family transcriptional regulator